MTIPIEVGEFKLTEQRGHYYQYRNSNTKVELFRIKAPSKYSGKWAYQESYLHTRGDTKIMMTDQLIVPHRYDVIKHFEDKHGTEEPEGFDDYDDFLESFVAVNDFLRKIGHVCMMEIKGKDNRGYDVDFIVARTEGPTHVVPVYRTSDFVDLLDFIEYEAPFDDYDEERGAFEYRPHPLVVTAAGMNAAEANPDDQLTFVGEDEYGYVYASESGSTPGRFYETRWNWKDPSKWGEFSCNCPGWARRGARTCKHTKMLEASVDLNTAQNNPLTEALIIGVSSGIAGAAVSILFDDWLDKRRMERQMKGELNGKES